MRRVLMVVLVALVLGGCASNVPREISTAPADSPQLQAVLPQVGPYLGRTVRWGGVIVGVENKAEETWVEVSARELDAFGRPRFADRSDGRFIARLGGFFDPSIYRADRELTVYGTLDGSVEGRIGERPYSYPVVRVLSFHLWPEYGPPMAVPYDPWWGPYYDPFMSPYYPYYWPRSHLYWRH